MCACVKEEKMFFRLSVAWGINRKAPNLHKLVCNALGYDEQGNKLAEVKERNVNTSLVFPNIQRSFMGPYVIPIIREYKLKQAKKLNEFYFMHKNLIKPFHSIDYEKVREDTLVKEIIRNQKVNKKNSVAVNDYIIKRMNSPSNKGNYSSEQVEIDKDIVKRYLFFF